MSRSEFISECDPKIYDKLTKLYNLAESAKKINSLDEANAALKMFRSIIAKHKLNINEDDFKKQKEQEENNERNVVREFLIRFKERRVFWKINLSSVLAKHMRCKTYLNYYKTSNVEYKYSIIVMGLKEDVEIVKYLFKSFIYIAEKCVKNYCDEFRLVIQEEVGKKLDTRTRAKIKNDYLEGFIEGLNAALDEQDRTDEEVALALVIPKEVNKEFSEIQKSFTNDPKLNKTSIRLRMHNPKIFSAGYNDGYNTGYNKNRRLE